MNTRIVVILLLLVSIVTALLVYSQLRRPEAKVSGFIEADEIRVGSRVGGRIRDVRVQEGQIVKAGDILIELEPFDLTQRRAQAAADLAARKADYERLSSGYRGEELAQAQARRDQLAAHLALLVAGPRTQEIAAGESRVRLAEAQLSLAEQTLKRVQASYERSAASYDELTQATDELKSAQSSLDVRKQELDQLKEGTRKEEIAQAKAQLAEAEAALALIKAGYRKEDVAAAKAAVDAATAAMAAIDEQIAELTIRAPLNGTIEAMELRPGDLVAGGAPVLSLMDTSSLWVRAYLPENHLGFHVGQVLPVTVDSYPGRTFAGHVSFIARSAEFTPSNVQTPEDRSKEVFRFKLTLDTGRGELRPGMMADVWLDRPAPATQP